MVHENWKTTCQGALDEDSCHKHHMLVTWVNWVNYMGDSIVSEETGKLSSEFLRLCALDVTANQY